MCDGGGGGRCGRRSDVTPACYHQYSITEISLHVILLLESRQLLCMIITSSSSEVGVIVLVVFLEIGGTQRK